MRKNIPLKKFLKKHPCNCRVRLVALRYLHFYIHSTEYCIRYMHLRSASSRRARTEQGKRTKWMRIMQERNPLLHTLSMYPSTSYFVFHLTSLRWLIRAPDLMPLLLDAVLPLLLSNKPPKHQKGQNKTWLETNNYLLNLSITNYSFILSF